VFSFIRFDRLILTNLKIKITTNISMVCPFLIHKRFTDLYSGGSVQRIVKVGETISSHAYENRVGGKGANQAIAIVRAGGMVQFYGTIGKDGTWIKDSMMNYGIDVSGIIISDVRWRTCFVASKYS
jgi:hypothetical protein